LLKSALALLIKRLQQESDESLNLDQVRVTYKIILDVYEEKHGSKIGKTLKSQSRQNLMLLRALSHLFEDVGEEKLVTQTQVFNNVNQMCR
jgi:hypothetical protein